MKVSELAESVFKDVYADRIFKTLKAVPKAVRNQCVDSYKSVFVAGFSEGFNHCAELEGTNWGYENDFHR